MISLYPTFYHTFQCKASDCNHTCCQKWTIDIDKDTAEFYEQLNTPLGDTLRKAITIDEDGHHFVFSHEQPTCALLNKDGLCHVVLELGEDALCQTCHMHPRFYKYVEDLELCGVGLSCEASVEGLLSDDNNHLSFTIEDDDGEFNSDERPILENIFQLLALDIDPQFCNFKPILELTYYQELINTYSKTEPIDDQWTLQLENLKQYLTTTEDSEHNGKMDTTRIAHATNDSKCKSNLLSYVKTHASQLNKIYQYIMYRQIDMLSEYSLYALIQYATDATHFITLSSSMCDNLPEQIRRWSEQIEYDEDNVELLFTSYDDHIAVKE